jgi:hypothetical protein
MRRTDLFLLLSPVPPVALLVQLCLPVTWRTQVLVWVVALAVVAVGVGATLLGTWWRQRTRTRPAAPRTPTGRGADARAPEPPARSEFDA